MEREPDLRVISLGAGVQSTAMYIMACEGVFDPAPTVAIFADTGGGTGEVEPPWVYKHLAWLEREFGDRIPIRRVWQGNLEDDINDGHDGVKSDRKKFAAIPAFLKQPDGKRGLTRRQCTSEYKLKPLLRQMRLEAGLVPRQRAKDRIVIEQWIGISLDEASRMRKANSATPWLLNRYPLIFDYPMRRGECLKWLKDRGYPEPKRSACFFCPFHSDAEWAEIRDDAPHLWERACEIDEKYRSGAAAKDDMFGYLHSSLKPLREVELKLGDPNQLDLFGNECEGMCGV